MAQFSWSRPDVAILHQPKCNVTELEIGDPSSVVRGDHLIIAGYPNYQFGDSAYVTETRVAGTRTVTAQSRYLLDGPIVAGINGEPVLDKDGRVVGIAVTGADTMENSQNTENH